MAAVRGDEGHHYKHEHRQVIDAKTDREHAGGLLLVVLHLANARPREPALPPALEFLQGLLLSRVRTVTFPGAGSGVAVLSDGRMVALPRIMGAPAFDPAAIPSARLIRLARMPTVVDLE